MGRCRVVRPDVVRVPLSDGDWIDVKKLLNAGEWAAMLEALNDPTTKEKRYFVRLLHYITGWSLVGFDGQVLPYDLNMPEANRLAALKNQDGDTLEELLQAVMLHEKGIDEERTARKNAQAGASASPAISASAA